MGHKQHLTSHTARQFVRLIFGCLLLMGAIPSLAEPAAADFKQAYREYQDQMKSGNYAQALEAASSAYTLSAKTYGSSSKTTAAMGLNYGQLLLNMERVVEAELVLKRTVAVSRRAHGDDSLDLIDIYMAYGHSVGDPNNYKKQRKFYKKAIRIAGTHQGKDSRLVADLNLEAGSNLLSRSEADIAERYLDSALKSYVRLDGNDSIGAGLAHYWLGKLEIGIERMRHAVPHFESAVASFRTLPNEQAHLLSSYAFLVRVHQEMGKRDAATPYCMEIGKLKPWTGNGQPTPLWVKPPTYSITAQASGARGYAEISFTITATGEAMNLSVLSAEGSSQFGSAAREAVAQWRFAPRFVDGKAVATQATYRVPFPFNI